MTNRVKATFQEGFADFNGHKTWYAIHGDITGPTPPLVALHGGPGYTHHHLQPLAKLAEQGIPVILYDQLGSGASSRPEGQTSLWTLQTFINQLAALRQTLGLERIHLLGHSWGGTLAAAYMLTKPQGVGKLILSSPLLDTQLWVRESDTLKDQLPPDIRDSMRRHEKAGTIESAEYAAAAKIFNEHFVCRISPLPDLLVQDEEQCNPEVYHTMWGPSEAHATGNLKDYSTLGQLGGIAVPTLLLSGRYDEATPLQMEQAQKAIPGALWKILEHSSHSAAFEEPEAYRNHIAAFLSA